MSRPTDASSSIALVLPFEAIDRGDVGRVGGKGANLGEMTRVGLPVPEGFVVTVEAGRRALADAGVVERVDALVARAAEAEPSELAALSSELRRTILGVPIGGALREAVTDAWRALGAEVPVAVRSSATAEDAAQHSFAGMFQTFLNVATEDALLDALRACWASGFSERVLAYRQRRGVRGDASVAVVVQRMVQSAKAGVLFTVDPASGDRSTLVVEGAFGLGEVVVAGQVIPDRYEVDKATGRVRFRRVGRKDFRLDRDPSSGENVRTDLGEDECERPVLDDAELARLAALARRLEAHYRVPQDAEWAIDDGVVWLVQTRPITTLAEHPPAQYQEAAVGGQTPTVLLRGLGASPGRASGPVRVLADPSGGAAFLAGEVLVAPTTTPDWVPLMRQAAAIVTDAGGMTSHAAIVSRELGVPCVVGTRDGTTRLQAGAEVTVDGRSGEVWAGPAAGAEPATGVPAAGSASATAWDGALHADAPVTATRLYVNLGEPTRAAEVAQLPVDGVGLLRAEFMILEALDGRHPRLLIERGRGGEFVDRMVAGLRAFGEAFHPRPVIYRTMDFKSNEFRGLEGGERYEPAEANPMIGYRGCARYVREPDLFGLELEALARAREAHPSLHLMIPFVRTLREFEACRALIERSRLGDDPSLELWVMAEVPSVVHWMADYVRLGATGFSIGSNDLTQLVLGIDRDSERLASEFDERDPAVLAAVEAIVRGCRRLGVTCSICGQAPSVHPDYVDRLVEWGIHSVSVTPDAVETTRRHLAAAERRLLLEQARRGA